MIPYGQNQTNEQQQHIPQFFFQQNDQQNQPVIDNDFLDKIEIDQESHNDWINQTNLLNEQKSLSFMRNVSRQYSNAQNYEQKENNLLSSSKFQENNLFQDTCIFQDINQYQGLQLQKSSPIKQITNLNQQKITKTNFYQESTIDKKTSFKKLKSQVDDQIQTLIQKYQLIDKNIDFKFIHLQKNNEFRENIIQELIQIFSVDLMQFNPNANSNSEKYKNKTFWCKCGSKYANYHGIKYHIMHQHQVQNGIQVPTWIWQVQIRSSFGRPKCQKEEETNK